MSDERSDATARMKLIVLACGAVDAGSTTSVAVAEATGMSVACAAARLRELEMMGMVRRNGTAYRYGKGTSGGRPATEWRPKDRGGW